MGGYNMPTINILTGGYNVVIILIYYFYNKMEKIDI